MIRRRLVGHSAQAFRLFECAATIGLQFDETAPQLFRTSRKRASSPAAGTSGRHQALPICCDCRCVARLRRLLTGRLQTGRAFLDHFRYRGRVVLLRRID